MINKIFGAQQTFFFSVKSDQENAAFQVAFPAHKFVSQLQ